MTNPHRFEAAPEAICRDNTFWFDLSIFLLITNQFGPVQKMKLHKGRAISEDDANGRLEPTLISLD
jgi:hypothetical protein